MQGMGGISLTHRWGDKEYHVVRVRYNVYLVAVWTDSRYPDSLYTVRDGRCSCPGFRQSNIVQHKHVKIVGEFRRLGEKPATFWIDGNEVKWRLL